jgi:hypothetical protein
VSGGYGSTAGPDGPASCGPRRGLGFEAGPEPAPADNTQHSTFWGLDYGDGDLVAWPPASQQAAVPAGGVR